MEKKIKSNQQGICPLCNSDNLEYEAARIEGDMLYYKWTCKDCNNDGSEWYNVEFNGHNIVDEYGAEIEISEEMVEN